jgi:transposase-like protein
MTKRKQYSAEYKNNVAMAAVRVDSKTTALSRKNEIQANIAAK